MKEEVSKAYRLFIGIYLIYLFLRFLPENRFPANHMTSILFYLTLSFIGIYALRKKFSLWFSWIRQHIWKSILYLFLCYALFMIGEGIASLSADRLFQILTIRNTGLVNDSNIQNILSILPAPVTILVLGILGPMVEEMIFRYVLFQQLRKYLSSVLSILISAVCFAMIHVNALTLNEGINVLPHFVTGLVFGCFYYKTDNLIFPIAVHAFNNASTLIVALL